MAHPQMFSPPQHLQHPHHLKYPLLLLFLIAYLRKITIPFHIYFSVCLMSYIRCSGLGVRLRVAPTGHRLFLPGIHSDKTVQLVSARRRHSSTSGAVDTTCAQGRKKTKLILLGARLRWTFEIELRPRLYKGALA